MATTNLSNYNPQNVPSGENKSIAVIVAQWNTEITEALYTGVYETLIKHGVNKNNIIRRNVPGTFELTYGCKLFVNYAEVDAIIAIGCVIKGETPHFEYVCQSVTQGLTHLNAENLTPIIFCVLTTNNLQQAIDRAGGKHGNKGVEAAIAALQMIHLDNEIMEQYEDNFFDYENDDDDDDDEYENFEGLSLLN